MKPSVLDRLLVHGTFLVDPEAGLIWGRRRLPLGSLDSAGYLQLDLRSKGFGLPSVARTVWEAVHGPIPAGLEINHRNGRKIDNRLANLELVTRSGNMLHAFATGLKRPKVGEDHPMHKLTAEQVREIRAGLAAGSSRRALAFRFGVARRTIAGIALGESWKAA